MDTGHNPAPWTVEGVKRLEALWREGVGPDLIAQAMRRPEADVRAKALELKLGNQSVPARP